MKKLIYSLKLPIRPINLIIFILVAGFLTLSLLRNIKQISVANEKITDTQTRLEEIKNANNELKDTLAKIDSSTYQEQQLRDKLGFAKEGEIVLVLPDEETIRKYAPKEKVEEEVLPDPNWKKWLNLFL